MNSYICRITIPYTKVQSFIDAWNDKASKLLVYEHLADEEVSQTHCHFLIQDCTIKEDRLKQLVNNVVSPPLKGNESWSWKKVIDTKVGEYVTYMTKGKLTACYNKGYEQSYIEEKRNLWVQPIKPEKNRKKDEIDELVLAFNIRHDISDPTIYTGYTDCICDRILGTCRTFTMAHVYRTTGKLPFPGTYKQTAGTLFLRVIEAKRPDLFEEALVSLKNIWY